VVVAKLTLVLLETIPDQLKREKKALMASLKVPEMQPQALNQQKRGLKRTRTRSRSNAMQLRARRKKATSQSQET